MPTSPVHQGCSRQPGQHLQGVVLLLLQILAPKQPVGVAGPPQVHPDRGVAVPGEVGVTLCVGHGSAVVLTIGQVLQNGRHRGSEGVHGHPDARGQTGPVRERDPYVVDLLHV